MLATTGGRFGFYYFINEFFILICVSEEALEMRHSYRSPFQT